MVIYCERSIYAVAVYAVAVYVVAVYVVVVAVVMFISDGHLLRKINICGCRSAFLMFISDVYLLRKSGMAKSSKFFPIKSNITLGCFSN